MSDRTGRALGTLSPVLYLENASGHLMLLPVEIGKGTDTARRLYEERYRHQGYDWREADTWAKVVKLQERLIEQETKILKHQGETMDRARERCRKETASNMRARMASADCDPWERDFIQNWLQLREDKRKGYLDRFTERNMYLAAVEFDNHRVEDRMGE